jgi:hypothetical protein
MGGINMDTFDPGVETLPLRPEDSNWTCLPEENVCGYLPEPNFGLILAMAAGGGALGCLCCCFCCYRLCCHHRKRIKKGQKKVGLAGKGTH